jgi:pantoate--beta-alanine ligase
MQQFSSVAAMQKAAKRWQKEGCVIGFVPTMGYLHEGHISLVHRARQLAGANSRIVVSIYVNPLQFGANEDLSKYPRDLARDRKLCQEAGVDALFVPSDSEFYHRSPDPAQNHSTYVVEEFLTRPMEGQKRPTHFRGVTTVVAKLFLAVLPDISVFGAKDWQQAAVIQRMVRDLNFPVKIVIAPTCREKDGLAMSSRNKYLSPEERAQAVILSKTWQTARKLVKQTTRPINADVLRKQLSDLIATQPAAKVDYIEFFHPTTLEAVASVKKGHHMALAVYVGKTRLIDNARL